MPMQNDRKIIISTGSSRKATSWPQQHLWWSEFVEKLRIPTKGTETLQEYLALSKAKQDDRKDVGGLVGGAVVGRRKAKNVKSRDLLALDLDSIPAEGTVDVLKRLEALGCAYVVYSTRKHEPVKPRLRVFFPLDRTVTVEEYEPIARKLAECVGIALCDPTTFDVCRLMYWPSCCADGEYIYQYADKPFISAGGVLAMYKDWRDFSAWPQVPGAQQARSRLLDKQQDPTTKDGFIGAFCRTYDVYRVMEELIPGAYLPCDGYDDRFSYAGSSTYGGAIVYDNGAFMYSHHASDPACGKLCNSFDLARAHMFGDLDDDAKPDTPVNKMPSYEEMRRYALNIEEVAGLLSIEKHAKAVEEFSLAGETPKSEAGEDHDQNWVKMLETDKNGNAEKTINNVKTIILNDPSLKGKIRLDTFADSYLATGPLPWELRKGEKGRFRWTDYDDEGLRAYLEKVYRIKGLEIINVGFSQAAAVFAFDAVQEFLKAQEWDNKPRLDAVFIDYLGAEDCEYTRAVTRKFFTAAVARAMTPGIKFDYMPVISGRQGIGKSTLLAKMGGAWFSDSIKKFEGKEAYELLQGVWICEVGEMEAYNKTDVRAVKGFLSKLDDQYRAAYARRTEKHPRRCVFCGTTNDAEYLKDTTGNRRFWPVDAEFQSATKSIFRDLESNEIGQIWAEAVVRWQCGEPLYLSHKLEEIAEKIREEHFDVDPLQGEVEDFLDKQMPIDWQDWSRDRRLMYWNGQVLGGDKDIKLVPRDRVCAAEIWSECMGMRSVMPKYEAVRINNILARIPGWERVKTVRFGGGYGRQKGFRKRNISGNHCQPLSTIVNHVNHIHILDVNHCQPLSTKK